MSELDTAPEKGTRRTVAVKAAQAGSRLDRVLAGALPDLSRTRLKALIEDGAVRIGGATIAEPSYRVKPGETIELSVPAAAPAVPAPEPIALDILYEDDDLLVVDKPAGLVVHPAPGNPDGTLVNALLAHCGASLSGIGGVRRPGIVHRLDKDTSGLMVVAKTDRAHAGLAAQFADRTLSREYAAIVWGVPARSQGEIEGNIGRSPRNRKKMAVLAQGGRPALTRYRVVRRFSRTASLVHCLLATGRTHQIRVHMAFSGHPLLGDRAYGGGLTISRRAALGAAGVKALEALGRQALHAFRLAFTHPVSGEAMKFETDLPQDLMELIFCLEQL